MGGAYIGAFFSPDTFAPTFLRRRFEMVNAWMAANPDQIPHFGSVEEAVLVLAGSAVLTVVLSLIGIRWAKRNPVVSN